jgi:AAA+ ATPase superfamily predicted ATPase
MRQAKFIGRKVEIEQLQAKEKKSPSLIVIYGRRRVGKSALIRETFTEHKVLSIEGIEDRPPKEQIKNFLFQLKQQCPNEKINLSANTWREALAELISVLKRTNYVLVLDEFQWMASYRSDLVSEFKIIWDQSLTQIKNQKVILCGSIASFMVDKVIRSSALYGRVTKEMHLKPFTLQECKELLSDFGEEELLQSVLCLGGIPLYLNLIKDYPSFQLALNDLGFKENGYFVHEYDRIFISHFGKKEIYQKIINALGKHEYGLSREQISLITKTPPSGNLSKFLHDLEFAGFIKSYTPFDKKFNSKIIKYVLTDPYLKFYLTWILPQMKEIKSHDSDYFLKIRQTAKFHSFLGRSFEILCINHIKKISEILGISGIDFRVGPYFRHKSEHEGVQIDLLFDRSDNVITICEMKYREGPCGVEVIAEVEKKVSIIKNISNKTIQKVLITKVPPSEKLVHNGYFYKIILVRDFFN